MIMMALLPYTVSDWYFKNSHNNLKMLYVGKTHLISARYRMHLMQKDNPLWTSIGNSKAEKFRLMNFASRCICSEHLNISHGHFHDHLYYATDALFISFKDFMIHARDFLLWFPTFKKAINRGFSARGYGSIAPSHTIFQQGVSFCEPRTP